MDWLADRAALQELFCSSGPAGPSIAKAPLDTLPLLDEYRRHHRARLAGIAALFVQHHLAPLPARVKAMWEDGLDPAQSWFLDIPYSTNEAVRDRLYRQLSPRHCAQPYTNPFDPYDSAQRGRVVNMLCRIAGQPSRADMLVVDDGAYVLKVLASSDVPADVRERFRNARVVEQTSRGHRFLESAAGQRIIRELDIVAVSVARSATKILFEAPAIGMGVGLAVKAAVARQRLEPRRALVIGYGAVGEASAQALRDTYHDRLEIRAVDPNDDALAAAAAQRFKTARAVPRSVPAGKQYDLVVGCTGITSFRWSNRGILSDLAVLASGSSTAVELDRERLVEQANRDLHDDFEVLNDPAVDGSNIHADLHFRYGRDRHFFILNAGFPVNFDGAPEHIPTVLIEPTHCLLYAAAAQALSYKEPGLRLLEPVQDYWILAHAERSLAAALGRPY